MPELEPITREEKFLNGEVGMTPITREEKILAGEDIETVTRREYFLKKYRGGGGGDVTVVPLSVTDNGTYSEEGKAYSPVSVNVPLPTNAYLLKSVANLPQAIASFSDGEEMVMPSLKVAIEPQQEGSGDPSPTNVRPISGWDEVDVTRCGKNLISSITEGMDLISATGDARETVGWYLINYIGIEVGKTYFLSGTSSATVCYYDKHKTFTRTTLNTRNIVPQEGECYVRCNSLIDGYSEPQIEEGNEATSFSPFGQPYTIDLDGTRYGGEVDVVNGVLTVLGKVFNVDETSDIEMLTSHIFRINKSKYPDGKFNGDSIEGLLCEKFKPQISDMPNNICYSTTNGLIIRTIDAYANTSEFFNTIGSFKFTYPLATPLIIQLTPTAVKSLLGTNNIWADTGDITDAEYFSKEV